VEIIAGPSSCIRYIAIQELSLGTVFHLKQRARAAADSSIISSLFSFGGSTARADLGTILEGRGASSRAFGVVVGNGSQHFDHHTVHLHRAPSTRSDFDFRSILAGEARSIYTGSIVIEKDAPGCEAFQINRNLMLSDSARADSIPELEIKNDDVRCSHGSATGPVEPIQVYYLMARGLPEAEAVRLVALGFAEQLFARVPGPIAERARACLASILGAQ
jgi:Fe-S cluster assembly protein SufD